MCVCVFEGGGVSGFLWVFLRFSGILWGSLRVLLGFLGFSRILWGFSGVVLGSQGFSRVFLGSLGFS